MSVPVVISESVIRSAIGSPQSIDRAFAAIRQSFIDCVTGTSVQPSPFHLDVAGRGEIHGKGAYLLGGKHVVFKLATSWPANAGSALSTSGGISIVMNSQTGQVTHVLCDNGWLTDFRTGIAGAIASHALARPDAKTVAIIGAGVQARLQAKMLLFARPEIENVVVWARNSSRGEECVRDLTAMSTWRVELAPSVEAAVSRADIVVTTTTSTVPLIEKRWLQPGTHITAVGSDSPVKAELSEDVLSSARLFVDDEQQSRERGECRRVAKDVVVVPLGDVLVDATLGRSSELEVTVADLTGIGLQDLAIATVLLQELQRSVDLGTP